MAQPAQPAPTLFYDEYGYFRSPEAAAAYGVIGSSGQSFTTPAREARRMLTSPDPRYVDMAQMWLMQHNLPEMGDAEPPDWQNWFSAWITQHPEAAILSAVPAAAPPQLHLVPPAPPVKVVVEVVPGSRLEALLAQQVEAKAAADETEKRMASIKAGIAAELTERHPGTGAFDIPGGPGRPALTLRYTAPRMFSAKEFKADQPALYEQYRRPSPRWTLAEPQKKGAGQ
jgi:hypothetical protein